MIQLSKLLLKDWAYPPKRMYFSKGKYWLSYCCITEKNEIIYIHIKYIIQLDEWKHDKENTHTLQKQTFTPLSVRSLDDIMRNIQVCPKGDHRTNHVVPNPDILNAVQEKEKMPELAHTSTISMRPGTDTHSHYHSSEIIWILCENRSDWIQSWLSGKAAKTNPH